MGNRALVQKLGYRTNQNAQESELNLVQRTGHPMNLFNIQKMLFLLLFLAVSSQCYSDNNIVVGLFCLTPCPDNPNEFSISMNKNAELYDEHENLCIPSQIEEDGKIYRVSS